MEFTQRCIGVEEGFGALNKSEIRAGLLWESWFLEMISDAIGLFTAGGIRTRMGFVGSVIWLYAIKSPTFLEPKDVGRAGASGGFHGFHARWCVGCFDAVECKFPFS